MKKIFILILTFMLIFLAGCSNDSQPQLFSYDVALRVPKGAAVSEYATLSKDSSPYYDEYSVKTESESDVITLTVEGSYFKPFEVNLNPDVQSLDCRSMAELSDGEEKKIINSAATYIIGLYYAAQKGEKEKPLDDYIYSQLPLNTANKLETYYNDISSMFCSFDPDGELISYGIYDLMFNNYFGNVVRNEVGAYTANITLSYSYIFKEENSKDKDVFDDITLGVDMAYEDGRWVVINLDNPLIQ